MPTEPIERRNWTNEELDLIVADYFTMLNDEMAGIPFSKAGHNRLLRNQIDRSEGSIEFKHQNISAVLVRLGLRRITGYLPASNYQKAIIPAVDRYISNNPVRFTQNRPPVLSLNGSICSSTRRPRFYPLLLEARTWSD